MSAMAAHARQGIASTSGRSSQQSLPKVSHHMELAGARTAAVLRPSMRSRRFGVVKMGSLTASRVDGDIEAARQNLAASLAAPPQPEAPAKAMTPAALKLAGAGEAGCPSQGWRRLSHYPSKEELWQAIREEAKRDADAEPTLASFLYSSLLVHVSFEKAFAFVLANKLASPTLFSTQLMKIMTDAYEEDPGIIESCIADLLAVAERDPACEQYTQGLLYFKGFQAIQAQRISHLLWRKGRKALALALQSRISEAFHVDIHPAARFGRGILLDHATGVVVGETAVVGDNVSMLHHVTLGGSGTGRGMRHPTIGHGVLLGAGVSVLGPVTVGAGTKVGAGSVVVNDLPCHSVAVGVPAKIIKRDQKRDPGIDMDQTTDFIYDYVI